MNIIEERDLKIDEMYEIGEINLPIINKHKITKDLFLNLKVGQKKKMIKKLLSQGIITNSQFTEYLKKITKEFELSKKNSPDFIEILFETEDYFLAAEYSKGKIRYFINQYGMKQYYNDLITALEYFVLICI